ncbi:MAG: hypothetical protein LBE10_09605 [Treponema sp.]|jgi:hypothetical protein|nr:hypothetical protein [Treponema sp.]
MYPGEKTANIEDSFETLLDQTCDRLQEKQIQYSINALRRMEAELEGVERELDAFLAGRAGRSSPPNKP